MTLFIVKEFFRKWNEKSKKLVEKKLQNIWYGALEIVTHSFQNITIFIRFSKALKPTKI